MKPGDCLLYTPTGVFGIAIAIKTWHSISHCECYVGQGQSVASRDGIGINQYPWRNTQLGYILRPNRPFNLGAAMDWFQGVRGEKYDWMGLLRFGWRAKYVPHCLTDNKMFCSEFLTRFYRAGGMDPFPREDADAIAPFQFESNPLFDLVPLPLGVV